MSEPAIKPVGRWCRECGQTGDHFPRCSHYMADDEESSREDVYTGADMCRAIERTILRMNSRFGGDAQELSWEIFDEIT